MKPIKFNAIINRISTKSDGSLGLTVETPEMTNEEILVVLRLRGINLDCTLTPLNQELDAPLEVKTEIDTKTPSERLRSVLYVLWCSLDEKSRGTFSHFYEQRMEKIIIWLKEKLPDNQ